MVTSTAKSNYVPWDELNESEEPAIELLRTHLGYDYATREELEAERETLRDVILVKRLSIALKRLNPWLSDENVKQAISSITRVQASTLLESNEILHTALTRGIALKQDLDDSLGKKGRSVRFFDFEDPTNNDFLVTQQFKIKGNKNIIPDIVIFVNGIPLAIIECKNPTINNPVEKGIDDLRKYQESEDKFRGLGAPHLFHTAQILISTCGQAAKYGTLLTPSRYWSEWKVPYPLTLDDVQRKLGHLPNPQEVVLFGMLSKENFLDIVRNFIVFDIEDGKTVKKICRYPQFVGVNRAARRILGLDQTINPKNGKYLGGIIWHTQGSGKSLTMIFLATKLRRLPGVDNPMIVMVTDRTNLDKQLSDNFRNAGFANPERASSVRDLRELVRAGNGKTVLTTVQKFMDLARIGDKSEKIHPILNEDENIFVMVDEAHRSQYRMLAANMRRALPNACFLGFTGTPIDKKDRSTFKTFGDYIHTYTIDQAVKDDATVKILYDTRLEDLAVEGNSLDEIFDRVFAEYSTEEREKIKAKFATKQAIAESKARIEQITLDLIRHYETTIAPNGFKAMIVAPTRDAAVTYKECLDKIKGPPSALIVSFSKEDDERLVRLAVPKDKQEGVIENFKHLDDPHKILIVCDMLTTGFDCPVLQVLYLDSPLKEHTLLQAVARVNRRAVGYNNKDKDYGLIMDYWGVSRDLQDALGVFTAEDIEGVLTPRGDELPRLESRHRAVIRFFQGVDKNDLEALIRVLEPEDRRAEFDFAFRNFTQSLDLVLPDPEGLKFNSDLRWLTKIRNAARVRYRDETLDLSGCGEKVKDLIDRYIRSGELEKPLEAPVSIFSPRFDEVVDQLNSPTAKASEMEHAIRHEIKVRWDENPVFYRSLRERLEEIIEQVHQERLDAVRQLSLLTQVMGDLKNVAQAAEEKGMSEDQFAIYKVLEEGGKDTGRNGDKVRETPPSYGKKHVDESKKELAALIMENLSELAVIDWQKKDDVQREMRRKIKQQLRAAGFELAQIEPLTVQLMDLARARFSA